MDDDAGVGNDAEGSMSAIHFLSFLWRSLAIGARKASENWGREFYLQVN
jgi:hypothetical protein